MNLTQNFKLDEFKCKDGSAVPLSLMHNVCILAGNLQVLRNELKKSIIITSAYRTPSYNAQVGGKPASKHLLAQAADIQVPGMTPKQVAAVIERLIREKKMCEGGIGVYNTFLHYDVRLVSARW